MKKSLRRTLWTLLIVVGIFALLIAIEHFRGKRSLEAYRQQLIAQGEKLAIEDLIPVRSAGEENGAPSLVAAASRLGQGKVVSQYNLSPMKMVAPGKARLATQQREWPNTNNKGGKDKKLPLSFSVLDLAEDIKIRRSDLEEIRTALRATNFNFNVNYRAGFDGLFVPHMTKVKVCAQWLQAASQHSLYATNLEASLENLEALAALSRTQEHEPVVTYQLVGQAMEQMGLMATWEALQTTGWSEAQLARLQTAWSPHRTLASLAVSDPSLLIRTEQSLCRIQEPTQ